MDAKILETIKNIISQNTALFLIDISVSDNQEIRVVVDGDKAVPVSDCALINRAIQEALRNENYGVQVSTFDITKPLVHPRQYKKNVNKKMEIKDNEAIWIGNLCEVSEKEILLKWKEREPKPIGKGKRTVEKQRKILFKNIIEAKVKLKF